VTRVALLDVNVLVALFDPEHVHHDLAHDWFAGHKRAGWATCPITENGLVRVLSNPAYPAGSYPAAALAGRLRTFCASGHHRFWPADVSLGDRRIFTAPLASGHRQITDVYLLGLAVAHAGALVTFDRSIPLAAVNGATREHLRIVAPG
jgi:toxin-antitoxin system PIN domain toxin